jgi:hypothetical protein
MTERTIDRVELLAEALEIEKAGGQWKVPHVMAVLDSLSARRSREKELWARSTSARRVDAPTKNRYRSAASSFAKHISSSAS